MLIPYPHHKRTISSARLVCILPSGARQPWASATNAAATAPGRRSSSAPWSWPSSSSSSSSSSSPSPSSGRRRPPPTTWCCSGSSSRRAPENSTISYDIAEATLSLRNPNLYRAISYGPMAAALCFNGTRFLDAPGAVRALDDGAARKTATISVKRIAGVDRPIKLSAAGVKEFRAQNETGKFAVEFRLDTELQYKGRKTKCPLVIVCPLQLQLVDPDVAATAFQKTKCTVLRAKKSGC